MKPQAETTRMRTPRTTTGQRRRLTHSLSGFEASHIPDAVMGMEQSSAKDKVRSGAVNPVRC
ncbi:hypothetical protein IGI04_025394 [Brassica rapa subsp. trilocularis]|uniref:Uncharacterized protein n=1 Tax=Brassica rapa subsp. trilocularis TaxID=1813537 RepID=A0ABQ7KTB2_BRACM|nr:hypothetical protein IGI04_025394 [Brassica rapa subsp. trilocularis]